MEIQNVQEISEKPNKDRSSRAEFWNRLKRIYRNSSFLFNVGVLIVILWLIIALFYDSLIPFSPVAQNLDVRFQAPSSQHFFGTDNLGRDVFSRTLVGSRISIMAGLITIGVACVIGTIYGGLAGYVGGVIDDVLMRISELVLSFPGIILAMVISAALGPSLYNTLFAMVIVWWPRYARVIRSMVISIKENEYIEAARVLGASNFRIFFIEIIPNSIGPVLVLATLDLGNAILTFAGLSFLGLGSPPPNPEWGAMVAQGVENFHYWWIATFPGLAILSLALGANFIGDGLRDFLDPRLRKEFR
jgi:peptide/nickel transport system permease protein